MSQTVNVTAGATEYTWPLTLTEVNGVDISADTVQISLGSYDQPGDWTAPVADHPTTSSVTVKLLIDDSVDVGEYWVWVKITDSPEIVPRRGDRVTVT